MYSRLQKEATAYGEPLIDILSRVETTAIRYQITNHQLHLAKDKGVAAIEEADRSRHFAHEALIDGVNLLSREFKKAGLDNEWRRDIHDRNAIGEWGLTIAKWIYKTFEGKQYAA